MRVLLELLEREGEPEDGIVVKTEVGLAFRVENFFSSEELVFDLHSNCCWAPLHAVPATASFHYCSECYEDSSYGSSLATYARLAEAPERLVAWLEYHTDPLTAFDQAHELAQLVETFAQELEPLVTRRGVLRLHSISWTGVRELCARLSRP